MANSEGGVTTADAAVSALDKAYGEGVLSHELPNELTRLRLLERLLDPDTTRILDQLGIQASWRCLEIGAGAGSIARWLAARCPEGTVLATDLNPRFLDESWAPNLQVRLHDVTTEEFPPESFDLIHARAVVTHLRDQESTVARAAEWLAPGGWLVLEEPDGFPRESSPYPEFRVLTRSFERLFDTRHDDPRWPRRIPAAMVAAGLVDIGMSVRLVLVGDGGPGERWWRTFMTQLRPRLVDGNYLTETGFDTAMAKLDDPTFFDIVEAVFSVWGRRPL